MQLKITCPGTRLNRDRAGFPATQGSVTPNELLHVQGGRRNKERRNRKAHDADTVTLSSVSHSAHPNGTEEASKNSKRTDRSGTLKYNDTENNRAEEDVK
jgi:hypothetical protein